MFEGSEGEHKGLQETLLEGGQGVKHLPALILLYIVARLCNLRLICYSPLALEVLRLCGFPAIRPRARCFNEVLHGEHPLNLLPYRPIHPAPVPDGSSPAEVSECAPGYRPTYNRFPAP